MSEILFFLMALLAEIIGTVGGFGSSVFFVPLASFYFPFDQVLALTAGFHLISNLAKLILFREGMNRTILFQLGIPAIFMVWLGAWLTSYLSSTYLEIGLGIFLVLTSAFMLWKPFAEAKPIPRNTISGGALSGFAAGLLGTGGAIRGLTMAAFNLEKSTFVSTSAAIDMGVDMTRTVVYGSEGYFRETMLIYVPILVVVGFLGSYIGKRLLFHISQSVFKMISLGLIALIGVITVLKALGILG